MTCLPSILAMLSGILLTLEMHPNPGPPLWSVRFMHMQSDFSEPYMDTPLHLVSWQQGSTGGVGGRGPQDVFRQLSLGLRVLSGEDRAQALAGTYWIRDAQRSHPGSS